jgi:hypothetical protein
MGGAQEHSLAWIDRPVDLASQRCGIHGGQIAPATYERMGCEAWLLGSGFGTEGFVPDCRSG